MKRVLVVAETNNAVYNLTKRLKDSMPDVKIINIGTAGREKVEGTDLMSVLENIKKQEEAKVSKNFRRSFNYDGWLRATLDSAEIITCTCTYSGDDMLEDMEFSSVVVDEATQATEPSILIALQHKCEKLIMIGDPCQLSPSLVETKMTGELGITMFHRLFSLVPTCFLNMQHRMHPELAAFPSLHYYNSKLMNAVKKEHRIPPAQFPW